MGKERIYANAQMGSREIRKYCDLGTEAEHLLERAMAKQGLSARAHDRILKVARTIADLGGAESIESGPYRRGNSVPDPGSYFLGVAANEIRVNEIRKILASGGRIGKTAAGYSACGNCTHNFLKISGLKIMATF